MFHGGRRDIRFASCRGFPLVIMANHLPNISMFGTADRLNTKDCRAADQPNLKETNPRVNYGKAPQNCLCLWHFSWNHAGPVQIGKGLQGRKWGEEDNEMESCTQLERDQKCPKNGRLPPKSMFFRALLGGRTKVTDRPKTQIFSEKHRFLQIHPFSLN